MAISTSVRRNIRASFSHVHRAIGARALICAIALLLAISGLVFDRLPVASTHSATWGAKTAPPRALDAYGSLPLRFEANTGQTDSRVKFLARGGQATLFLTTTEAVLQLRGKEPGSTADRPQADVLRLKLANANRAPVVVGMDELRGRTHYFTGRDFRRWRTDVASFGRVKYEAVYPGIDLVYYGHGRQLEYDFIVAPGADAGRIRLAFEGARGVGVNQQGELVLRLAGGEARQRPPVVYQGDRRRAASDSGALPPLC